MSDARWCALASLEGTVLLGGAGQARVLEQGAHGLLLEVRYPAGVSSAEHSHEHDSYIYVLSGHIIGTVAGEAIAKQPGASLVHPARIAHSIAAVVDSRWLEFKTPPPPFRHDASGALHIGA